MFGFSLVSVVVFSFSAAKIVIQRGNSDTGHEIRDQEVFDISLEEETRVQSSEDQEQVTAACTRKELGCPCCHRSRRDVNVSNTREGWVELTKMQEQ